MNRILLILISSVLVSCNIAKNRPVELAKVDFSTDDGSELFFRNVRASYYTMEEVEGQNAVIYNLNKPAADSNHLFNHKIVFNWGADKAFLFFNSDKLNSTKDYKIICSNHATIDTFLFNNANVNFQRQSALMLYNKLVEGYNMKIIIEDDAVDLFSDIKQKERFRITVFDFLGLVGYY